MWNWLINLPLPNLSNLPNLLSNLLVTDLSSITTQFTKRSVDVFEMLVLADGIIGALKFIKEYFVYKLSPRYSSNQIVKRQIELVSRYRNLYRMNIAMRYILYIILNAISYVSPLPKYSVLIFTIPDLQNVILRCTIGIYYLENIEQATVIFTKYFASKIIIQSIQSIHPKIDEIKNYHIFILYQSVSIDYILDFIKSYVLIYCLYFLRNSPVTYYYYKAIKLAYYYNTGFLFNIVETDDAVYLINAVIHDKKWKNISQIEIVNAFYSLTFNLSTSNQYYTFLIYVLKFLSLWSLISFVKILSIQIQTTVLIAFIIISILFSPESQKNNERNQRIERIVLSLCVYLASIFDVYDIVIAMLLFSYKFLKFGIQELGFFIVNYNSILKMIVYYEKGVRKIQM